MGVGVGVGGSSGGELPERQDNTSNNINSIPSIVPQVWCRKGRGGFHQTLKCGVGTRKGREVVFNRHSAQENRFFQTGLKEMQESKAMIEIMKSSILQKSLVFVYRLRKRLPLY